MCYKFYVAFAALCTLLLVSQSACEDFETRMPDELYILNSDSVFPIIVTDPNSPLLAAGNRQVIYVCYVQRCQQRCRDWGYRFGRCNSQAICVCSHR
ncbi:jg17658 [Pararge aegeria aegeria]|uniref:Jg17658 protein n=1 Tax=Pararge aegeria aegeria TaxID=348720 RepID=A0A8S4RHM7_9NEOP|nr:jg17658 [Pararge aegeria aegeria]